MTCEQRDAETPGQARTTPTRTCQPAAGANCAGINRAEPADAAWKQMLARTAEAAIRTVKRPKFLMPDDTPGTLRKVRAGKRDRRVGQRAGMSPERRVRVSAAAWCLDGRGVGFGADRDAQMAHRWCFASNGTYCRRSECGPTFPNRQVPEIDTSAHRQLDCTGEPSGPGTGEAQRTTSGHGGELRADRCPARSVCKDGVRGSHLAAHSRRLHRPARLPSQREPVRAGELRVPLPERLSRLADRSLSRTNVTVAVMSPRSPGPVCANVTRGPAPCLSCHRLPRNRFGPTVSVTLQPLRD